MTKISSALIVYNHKLLLHLRDSNHSDPNARNKWGLVGGIVEINEEPMTAVRREILEETNLNPRKIEYIGKFEIDKPNSKIEVNLFCSLLTAKEAKLLKLGNEGLDVKFFSPDEIITLPLSSDLKKYYLRYQVDLDNFINKGIIPSLNFLDL